MNVKEMADWLLKTHPHDATVWVIKGDYNGCEEIEFNPNKTQSIEYNALLLGIDDR